MIAKIRHAQEPWQFTGRNSKMTRLMINLFGYNQAQTILTRTYSGERWYMAADICRLLGIIGYSQAVHTYLESWEWKKRNEYTGSCKRQLLMINESGVYKLIQIARGDIGASVRVAVRRLNPALRPACWPEERLAA